MIDERRQDLAAAYAFNALDAGAAREFEAELAADPELRAFTDELRETAAALAHLAPRQLPPPQLRERVMAAVRSEAVSARTSSAKASPASTPVSRGLLPWALAAGLAITTAAVWMERDQWRSEALALRQESFDLRNRDAFAKLRIATLTAQVEAFAKGSAVVVWDGEKQRGVVKLSDLPPTGPGKDYQLWVIDAKAAQPINGGVIPMDSGGYARVAFTPDQPVRKIDKFAISIEPTGGVPKATGPIVFVGE